MEKIALILIFILIFLFLFLFYDIKVDHDMVHVQKSMYIRRVNVCARPRLECVCNENDRAKEWKWEGETGEERKSSRD